MGLKVASLLLAFLLVSCYEEAQNPVRVTTKGIYDPISILIDGKPLAKSMDLGEFVRGGLGRLILLEIHNNSGYPVHDISLEMLNLDVNNFDFALNEEGKKVFPGEGGTCQARILASGKSCSIALEFTAMSSGEVEQTFRLRYKNIVEPGDETFSLRMLAGTVASLIFVPDTLNYHFGNLTGAAQIPLVERNERLVRSQTLTITNAGELSARSMLKDLRQNCSSKQDGTCPGELRDSYRLVAYDCPDTLASGEVCSAQIEFENKNQGDDPVYKNVAFNSTLEISYERDPAGNTASLNAYFESVSANIEAFLEPSLNTIDFQETLTAGNREKISFNIKNTGFREGFLRRLNIYPAGDSERAFSCEKGTASILNCYDAAGAKIGLNKLPIFFNDVQDCMNLTMDKPLLNDSQCLFEAAFQPSLDFTADGDFDYDIRLEYDTRFLGQETIVESATPDIRIRGKWKIPAKLEWLDFRVGQNGERTPFENAVKVVGLSAPKTLAAGEFYSLGGSGADIPLLHQNFFNACAPSYDLEGNELGAQVAFANVATGAPSGKLYQNYQDRGKGILIESSGSVQNGSVIKFSECKEVAWSDLGRLAMELWQYYDRDSVQFRFLNTGGTPATNIRLSDGSGNLVHPSMPVDLGIGDNACSSSDSGRCPFYQSVTYSCPSLDPSSLSTPVPCVISFQFSPIDREADSEEDSRKSMFDYQGETPFENYKAFALTYDNGARFSDENLASDIPDVEDSRTEARLHGVLVYSGLISKIEEFASTDMATAGQYNYQAVLLRNIGTGKIPYLYDNGINFDESLEVVPTPVGYLSPGVKDCYDIIDWASEGNASGGGLESSVACLLTFRAQVTNRHKASSASLAASRVELARLFNTNFDSDFLWEYWETTSMLYDVKLGYYDGDITNEEATGDYKDTFGQVFEIERVLAPFMFGSPPHIAPSAPTPEENAIIARPSFNKGILYREDGQKLFNAESVPSYWFYSAENHEVKGGAVSRKGSDRNDALFSYRNIARGKEVAFGSCSDCDYAIHFGSFRSDQGFHELTLGLQNFGFRPGTLVSVNLVDSTGKFALLNGASLSNTLLGRNASAQAQLSFSTDPADTGVYSAVIEYVVDSGIPLDKVAPPNQEWTFRIELIAEALAVYPNLALSYVDYEVSTFENEAPMEVLGDEETDLISSYGLNEIPSPELNGVMMEMVKLEEPGPYSGYVKKRLVVRRENLDILNLETIVKIDIKDKRTTALALIPGVEIVNGCSGASLTEAQPECYVDVKYQPTQISIVQNMVLTFVYELQPGQVTTQNALFQLVPKAPGFLYPEDPLFAQTFGGLDAVHDSEAMALDFGNAVYDLANKTIHFNDIVILNDSDELRASFLRSWQMFKGSMESGVYPLESDWVTTSQGRRLVIYRTTYPDDQPRITVAASEGCIYGEIPPGYPDFNDLEDEHRGFLAGFDGCSLDVSLRLNANYINQNLGNREPYEVMGENYFRLHYYSYARVETSYLSFYFKGKVLPDPYEAVGGFYDVYASDNKTVEFSFDDVLPRTPGVGALSGYRVYYSESLGALNDVLSEGGKYLEGDFSAGDGKITIAVNNGNLPEIDFNKAFYFKLMAIRSNPDYTAGGFAGLPAGTYLSDGNLPVLRVVVPQYNYAYLHDQQVMVRKDVERGSGGPQLFDYAGAQSACSGLGQVTILDPSSSKGRRSHRLINESIWEALRQNPDPLFYSGGLPWLSQPHWLQSPVYNLEAIFREIPPGYTGEPSQEYPDYGLFYFRCQNSGCSHRAMGGSFVSQPFSDYMMYIAEDLPLGYARCYLPTER